MTVAGVLDVFRLDLDRLHSILVTVVRRRRRVGGRRRRRLCPDLAQLCRKSNDLDLLDLDSASDGAAVFFRRRYFRRADDDLWPILQKLLFVVTDEETD